MLYRSQTPLAFFCYNYIMSMEREEWESFRPDPNRVAGSPALVRFGDIKERSDFVGLLNLSGVDDKRISLLWHGDGLAALMVQQLTESEFWRLMHHFWKEMKTQDEIYRKKGYDFDSILQSKTDQLLTLKSDAFRCCWRSERIGSAADIRRMFEEQCGDVNPAT